MTHAFAVDIATRYGVTEALLLSGLFFRSNDQNWGFHDGEYWVRASMRELCEKFPYLTIRKIRNALNHLQEVGILKVGNYNADGRDRTLWYAIDKI